MIMEMENSTPKIFSDIVVFRDKFPTGSDVLRVFHPDNWGQFLKQQDKCLTAPRVTLAELADHYGEATIKELVQQQFVGLHQLSSQRELNFKGVGMAADLFLSQFGNLLTPYSTMLYFGLYPSKFKDSFRENDFADILKQCPRFLRWWQSQQPQQEPEQQQESQAISLEMMVRVWVNEGRTDEDFRCNSGLYHAGKITDSMIAQARREAEEGIF